MTTLRYAVLAVALASAAAREPFPADVKMEDLDSNTTDPYIQGVLFESSLTAVIVVGALTFVLLCASLATCLCFVTCAKRKAPGMAEIEFMKEQTIRACVPEQNTVGIVFLALLVLCGGILVASSVASARGTEMSDGLEKIHDETDIFLLDASRAMCTDDKEDLENDVCMLTSFNKHAIGIRATTIRTFDSIIEAHAHMEEMTDTYRAEAESLNATATKLRGVEDGMDSIDAALSQIQSDRTWLRNPVNAPSTAVTTNVPSDENLPEPLNSLLRSPRYVAVDTFATQCDTAASRFFDDVVEPAEAVEADFYDVAVMVDADPDNADSDVRGEVADDVLGMVIDKFKEMNGDVLDASEQSTDGRGDVERAMQAFQDGLTMILLLPVIVMASAMALSCGLKKASPLALDMCFVYLFVALYVGLAFLFSASGIIVHDFCESHVEFIRTQVANQTFTIGNSEVVVEDSVEETLRCRQMPTPDPSDYPWATDDNNFINIWGIEAAFDVSNSTSSVSEGLAEALAGTQDIITGLATAYLWGATIPTQDPVAPLIPDQNDAAAFAEDVTDYAAMVAGLDVTLTFTQAKKDEVLGRIASMQDAADSLVAEMAAFNAASEAASGAKASFDASISDASDSMADSATALGRASQRLNTIVQRILGTNNYALCGYVGRFYEKGVEHALCGEFSPAVNDMPAPLLAVVLFMDLSVLFVVRALYKAKRHADASAEMSYKGDGGMMTVQPTYATMMA